MRLAKVSFLALAMAAMVFCSSQANASIVSTSGSFDDISGTAGIDVTPGALESSTLIRVFSERSNVTVGAEPGLTPGTVVNSHFVHWDPTGSPGTNTAVFSSTTVTFSHAILAVYSADDDLDDTDATFGLGDATYPVGGLRGTRPNAGEVTDAFSWAGNSLTITTLYTENAGIDQLRIVTVPEPTSFAMFGLALVGFARRKRS